MAPSVMLNFDARQLHRKLMRDMAEAQVADTGLVPDIAPEYAVFEDGYRDSPEWGSAVFFLADFMLRRYGDETGARLYYASTMIPYMAYLLAQANQTATPYILDYGLGDWCDANTIVSDDCSPDGQLTSTRVVGLHCLLRL